MTRPIYEPSLTRTDAYLGYGQDQLFRRPAPAAAVNEIDWAIANGDIDEIVADKTTHNIPYASVDIAPNSACFQVGATNIKPIKIIKNGWYMIYLEAWPGGVGNAGNYVVGLSTSGSGFFYNASYSAGGLYSRTTSYDGGNMGILQGFQHSFGPFYAQAVQVLNLGAFVYHALNTPGTIDWNYGMLAAVYMGPGLGLLNTSTWAPDGLSHDEQFRTYF